MNTEKNRSFSKNNSDEAKKDLDEAVNKVKNSSEPIFRRVFEFYPAKDWHA